MKKVSCIALGEIMPPKPKSVNPARSPDEVFDLYSIPAFDRGQPDVVKGQTIGSSKQVVQPGDVLLSRIVPHIRRSWIVGESHGRTLIASSEWIVFRSDQLHSGYLRHVLVSDHFHSQFIRTVSGVGGSLLRARRAYVARIKIPILSLEKQSRITKILDRAEALRDERRAALAQLDTLTQAIFLEMFGRPMVNDVNWPVVTVGEAGQVKLGRQRAPKYQTGKFTRPYLRVANVFEDHIDLSDLLSMDFDDRDFPIYRLEYGDILLNEGQSTELVGRPAMWRAELEDCCFQNTLVRFRANRERVIPEFALAVFLYYFRSGEFAKISSKTSNVAHLGSGRFSRMHFPVPPLSLQREYARRVAAVEKLKSAHRASLAQLDELFASLQQRAFRGEL